MDLKAVLRELEAAGTAQNRKVYARHGVAGDMYGVSYAHLGKLRKKIKTDHELAAELWTTGNHDARVLATQIADPARATRGQLDGWLKDCHNYVLTDALAAYAARTPLAHDRMQKWIRSRQEFVGLAGWSLVAHLATRGDALETDVCESLLGTIERDIHASKNRVRHAMNGALIAIGLRSKALQRQALAAAKRIGRVEVDHGETGCKTPDAAAYIKKAAARRR
jgi:3-methyladenine DNA glycosylase AlkD